jgi:hypothetical protein
MVTFYVTTDVDSLRDYMPDVPLCLPASSWARYNLRKPNLPEHISEVCADCGGFVATFRWGDYRYSPEQYIKWLHKFSDKLSWAAMMDYCCEPEITGKQGIVVDRQKQTTEIILNELPRAYLIQPTSANLGHKKP